MTSGSIGSPRRGLVWLAVLLAMVVSQASDRPLAADARVADAARAGDEAAVRSLIAAGEDVNVPAADGSSALLWAAYHGDAEMAAALVAAGAGVDVANRHGVTPLLQACRTAEAKVVEVLLDAGASPLLSHPEGETPLMAASRTGNVDVVARLLARGASVNTAESVQGQTALMWAAAEGHGAVVDLLLAAGADPNRQAHITSLTERHNADHPTGGFTALMFAARNGHADVVRRLVAGGADLNLTNGDNATATMIAIYNDRFDMAATLLHLGASADDDSLYVAVEMRDATTDQFAFDGSRLRPNHDNQWTALDLMRLLLQRGADPNRRFSGQLHSASMPNTDRFDNSPFLRAAIAADVEALKLLIAHGADLEQTPPVPPKPQGDAAEAPAGAGRGNPNAGRTATMVVQTGGRGPGMTGGPGYIRSGAAPYREPGSRTAEEAFTVLLEGGANPDAVAPDGSTLLHQVARTGNLDMIRALARAGVDFSRTNADGLTALDVAEGKRPAGARAGAGGRRGGPPPAGRGRGGRGGASQQDVARLLRELMGLPPAPLVAERAAERVETASRDGAAEEAADEQGVVQ